VDGMNEITDAIVYGWDGGKMRALEALRPYVRHLEGCWADPWAEPDHAPCNCGLRLAWRIRETTE
jgi:hypothetical protein